MKFTLSWLKEHLDTQADLGSIAAALTDLGLEVEAVTDPRRALAPFRLGRVVSAAPHPDADRLRVCQVETEQGARQIVCGAPNAREGMIAVIAAPGDHVPGTDTTIGVGRIRGVESHGMMVSERELGLGQDHDGIIDLPSGTPGQSFADWLAAHDPARVDPVIEIAITPNRPDALGVRGIARDLAARGLGILRPAPDTPVEGSFPCPIGVTIAADTSDGCPLFCGRLIRGVRNGPSPDWLQRRLSAVGLRPISFLVDVTNFFTHDRARPLHVFDAASLTGDLRVRRATGGERLAALDDRSYALAPGMMVIADDAGPQSIAGIVGGADTGVTESTTDVFLESAYWDPVTIAAAGRALKVQSDARYRFERGVDPAWTPKGLDAATRMILQIAGGEASQMVQAGAVPDTARRYAFDPERVSRLVGMEIPADTQRATLAALGFDLAEGSAGVPSWRPDVQGPADLVEEVARIASLSGLQGRPLPRQSPGVPKPVLTPAQRREGRARRRLAALGYDECVGYSFIDAPAASRFGGGRDDTRLDNPISSELSHMRPSLLPGLLAAAARNQARGAADLALFEVGPVFFGGEPGEQTAQAAGLLVGHSGPRDPHGERRLRDLYDVRADAQAVLSAIGAPKGAGIARGAAEWFHPGRSARLTLGPRTLAEFGELHPKLLAESGLRGSAAAFTIALQEVPARRGVGAARPPLTLSDLQPVDRDFAFVLDRSAPAEAVAAAARTADRALVAEVSVFDVFDGPAAQSQMGEGKKSLAISVRLQPRDHTLTEAEIDAVGQRIVAAVEKATGGSLRR